MRSISRCVICSQSRQNHGSMCYQVVKNGRQMCTMFIINSQNQGPLRRPIVSHRHARYFQKVSQQVWGTSGWHLLKSEVTWRPRSQSLNRMDHRWVCRNDWKCRWAFEQFCLEFQGRARRRSASNSDQLHEALLIQAIIRSRNSQRSFQVHYQRVWKPRLAW